VIIFTHHIDVLDQLQRALDERTPKVRYIRIDGKTPPQSRQGMCDQFQRDEGVRAALLTINATGMGLLHLHLLCLPVLSLEVSSHPLV